MFTSRGHLKRSLTWFSAESQWSEWPSSWRLHWTFSCQKTVAASAETWQKRQQNLCSCCRTQENWTLHFSAVQHPPVTWGSVFTAHGVIFPRPYPVSLSRQAHTARLGWPRLHQLRPVTNVLAVLQVPFSPKQRPRLQSVLFCPMFCSGRFNLTASSQMRNETYQSPNTPKLYHLPRLNSPTTTTKSESRSRQPQASSGGTRLLQTKARTPSFSVLQFLDDLFIKPVGKQLVWFDINGV